MTPPRAEPLAVAPRVLVTYLANTGLRAGEGGALAILALAWVASIGWMALVNVLIDSAFKWPLLALALAAVARRGSACGPTGGCCWRYLVKRPCMIKEAQA